MTVLKGQAAASEDFRTIFKLEKEISVLFAGSIYDDWDVQCGIAIENQYIGLLFWRAGIFWAWASVWTARLAWTFV